MKPGPRIALLMALLSIVYAAAMFRGLECHAAYAGCAYQTLYPQSFPGDAFMPAHRPYMLSFYYYPLVKMAGPLWLDDRFTFVLFVGMAVLCLIALDKTARRMGASHWMERAAVLGFVLLEHRFFINHVLLVDNYGFNGTALGGAAALWILYGALAGWGFSRQIPLIVLGLGISLKNAWLPSLIACFFLWKDRLGPAAKRRILLASTAAAVGGVVLYYAALRPAHGTDVALFDYLAKYIDGSEANPFLYPLWSNVFFAGFCLLAFLLRDLPKELLGKVRGIAVIGLLAWGIGGLYLSCAPDLLKVPYLVPTDVRRALRWPLYVLFVALGVSLLKQFQQAPSGRAARWIGLSFFALYFLHEQFRWNLVVLTLLLLFCLGWRYRKVPWQKLSTRRRLSLLAVPVVAGTLSLYAVGAIHHRRQALAHLIRTGIIGDNVSAQWVGINEYLREKTPTSATVLAFSLEDADRKPAPLHFDASLRTRSGRTMPWGYAAAFYVDYPKLQWWGGVNRRMEELAAAWDREDLAGVAQRLAGFGPPDVLVIPTVKSGWAEKGASELGYRVDAKIGEFTLFRHDDRF